MATEAAAGRRTGPATLLLNTPNYVYTFSLVKHAVEVVVGCSAGPAGTAASGRTPQHRSDAAAAA